MKAKVVASPIRVLASARSKTRPLGLRFCGMMLLVPVIRAFGQQDPGFGLGILLP